MTEIATPSPIEAAATATTAPPAPTTTPSVDTAMATPAPTNDSNFLNSGGELDNNEKIQWVAITIFSIAMIALVYKAMYYKKSLAYLNSDNKAVNQKIEELEKNLKAVRGKEYEPIG